MLIRFVVYRQDEDSRVQLGVFQAIYELRDSGDLATYEFELIQEELDWFNKNLEVPDVLGEDWTRLAISWFKPEALAGIERIRILNHLLEEQGYLVKMLKTDSPGRIIYQDDSQVVAIPNRDGPSF